MKRFIKYMKIIVDRWNFQCYSESMKKGDSSVRCLAKEIGISPSTISRVLNHPELVKESTRKLVFDYLGKNDTVVLKSKKTPKFVIGLTVSDPNSLFIASVISAIEKRLVSTRYQLMLFNLEKRRDVCEFFKQHLDYLQKIDGLIIATSTLSSEGSKFFKSAGIPLVLFQSKCQDEQCFKTNDYKGGRDSALFLLSRGYKKIAFVGWEPGDEHIQERFQGFISVCPITKEYHISTTISATGGYQATEMLMSLPIKPDAIFYGCDAMAAGGVKYFQDFGISNDCKTGIMGFDDLPIAELMGITTMSQFIDKEISMAVDYLIKKIEYPNIDCGHDEISVTPKLIVRKSTK